MNKKMYNEISELYDKVFPFSKQKLSFLNNYLQKGKILDLACGTGTYTIPLAKENEMSGFDLDEGMIKIAKSKSPNNIDFKVKNMMDVNSLKEYNSIFSIGNSIVHITDLDKLGKLLKNLNVSLKDEGVLILQIVNYDRILTNNIKELPKIENEGVTFTRRYNQKNNGLIDFITTISYKDFSKTNQVELVPLKKDLLINLLEKSNFEITKTFGSFNEEPFSIKDSFHLILICKKRKI